jgi:hypothetical protein
MDLKWQDGAIPMFLALNPKKNNYRVTRVAPQ